MRQLTNVLALLVALATITGGLLAFWQWWDAPKADLQASVSVSEFVLPPDVAKDVASARRTELSASVAQFLKHMESAESSFTKSADQEEKEKKEFSLEELYGQPLSPGNDFNGMVQVEVKNTGDAPSKNVMLRLPSRAGYILIKNEAGVFSSFKGEQTLQLGDLRKAEKALVWYWDRSLGGSMGFSQIEEGLFVTDDNATGSVTIVAPMSYDEFKSQARIERILYSLVWAIGIVCLLGAIGAGVSARRLAANQRSNAGPSRAEEDKPD